MLSRERPSLAPTRRSLAGLLAATAALAVPTMAAAASAEPDAELIALGRELEAAWAVDRKVCAEISDDSSDVAEAKIDAACDRSADIAHRIEALTATTLAGLRVKLLAVDWCRNENTLDVEGIFGPGRTTDIRLIVAILADLRATG